MDTAAYYFNLCIIFISLGMSAALLVLAAISYAACWLAVFLSRGDSNGKS
jgi:hypothetical protein